VSDELYWTRLRWFAPHGGIAKMHGQVRELLAPPVLGGERVSELDYVPEIGLYQIRRRAADAAGDMTAAEIHDADVILRELCSAPQAEVFHDDESE